MTSSSKVLAYIHETAVIAPTARIARNVEIGPYAVISDHVQIGEGTKIGPHVVIKEWTQIGRDCHIFQGASIGEVPQDLKFKGEKSYTFIGDRTTIRECATVHRATGEGEETRIGDDCLLMAYTHIAHNCVLGNRIIMSNAAMLAGHATVEDGVVIVGDGGRAPVREDRAQCDDRRHVEARAGCCAVHNGGRASGACGRTQQRRHLACGHTARRAAAH